MPGSAPPAALGVWLAEFQLAEPAEGSFDVNRTSASSAARQSVLPGAHALVWTEGTAIRAGRPPDTRGRRSVAAQHDLSDTRADGTGAKGALAAEARRLLTRAQVEHLNRAAAPSVVQILRVRHERCVGKGEGGGRDPTDPVDVVVKALEESLAAVRSQAAHVRDRDGRLVSGWDGPPRVTTAAGVRARTCEPEAGRSRGLGHAAAAASRPMSPHVPHHPRRPAASRGSDHQAVVTARRRRSTAHPVRTPVRSPRQPPHADDHAGSRSPPTRSARRRCDRRSATTRARVPGAIRRSLPGPATSAPCRTRQAHRSRTTPRRSRPSPPATIRAACRSRPRSRGRAR